MKNLIKKIVKIFILIVISFSFLIALLAVIQEAFNVEILPYKIAYVLTNSMEDTINKNSYILIKKVDTKKLKENDIITFVSKDPAIYGELNTHRIVGIIGDNKEFITKGDHNKTEDIYHVASSDIKGVFVCKLVLLTKFSAFFKTKTGLIVTLSIIILVFILSQIFYNFILKNSKNNKKTTC